MATIYGLRSPPHAKLLGVQGAAADLKINEAKTLDVGNVVPKGYAPVDEVTAYTSNKGGTKRDGDNANAKGWDPMDAVTRKNTYTAKASATTSANGLCQGENRSLNAP